MDPEPDPELNPAFEPFLGFDPALVDPFFNKPKEVLPFPFKRDCILLLLWSILAVGEECMSHWEGNSVGNTDLLTRKVILSWLYTGLMVKWRIQWWFELTRVVYSLSTIVLVVSRRLIIAYFGRFLKDDKVDGEWIEKNENEEDEEWIEEVDGEWIEKNENEEDEELVEEVDGLNERMEEGGHWRVGGWRVRI